MKNLLLPISLGLLVSVSTCFAGDDAAEQQFKAAKAAYENNNCESAAAGFRNYLQVARPGEERKKSIQAALAWCEKQNRKRERYARMSMTAVGSSAPSAMISPVPMTPPKETIPAEEIEAMPRLP